ncbi:MAG: tetratricopeptide repeat protein [Candidatus Riflebacteria bacterium]|nr:tetratricopeptide repeat protein [Candidatus Riflebacteria bacterium]
MKKSSLIFSLLFIYFVISLSSVFADADDDARIMNRSGLQKARKGDWEGAIAAFSRAKSVDPFDEISLTNLAGAYNNLGVKLCRQENYSRAISNFQKAKNLKPEDLDIRFNMLSALVLTRDSERLDNEAHEIMALRPYDDAVLLKVANAFSKLEDDESARNLLEKILAHSPDNADALFQIGQIYYKQGNTSESRFYLGRARESSSGAPFGMASASLLLAKINREDSVESNYLREKSVNFSLTYCDWLSPDLAHEILELFEEAYSKVGEFMNFYPSQRTEVIVYARDEFSRVNSLPGWAGGLYDGKIRLPVSSGETSAQNLHRAVFHEYCHHLIYLTSAGRCPAWLNEGLAQVAEGSPPDKAKQILARDFSGKIFPLSKMDQGFPRSENRDFIEKLYAQSLAITGIMIEEQGIQAVRNLLKSLANRDSLENALSTSGFVDLATVEEKLRSTVDSPDKMISDVSVDSSTDSEN